MNPLDCKEINPEYSLEGLMLMLKLQYFGHLMQSGLTQKDPDAGRDGRQEEKGTTEDEMVGWHHRLNGREFGQALGDSKGQGSLACCSPWSHKELGTFKRMNNNRPKLSHSQLTLFYLENKHPEGEKKNNPGCMVRPSKVAVPLFSVPPLLNQPLLHLHHLWSPNLCLPRSR